MNGIERLERQMVRALRDHLEAKDAPNVPRAGVPLWRAFLDLDATRTMHAAGPNPISHAEIESWARLNRWPLQPRHVRVIRALDTALLDHFHEKAKGAPEGKNTLPRESSNILTPKLFDAAIG